MAQKIENPTSAQLHNRTHQAVLRAVIRGELTPSLACANCGGSVKIVAHHEDYNLPLDVDWLCTPCHVWKHRNVTEYYKRTHARVLPNGIEGQETNASSLG